MTNQNRSSLLTYTLGFIGLVQLILGFVFIFAANQFADAVGLDAAQPWALWMFAMFGARAWGFAYGMFLAMRDPLRHSTWIRAMIFVQSVDWLATVYYLLDGRLTLSQVTTAAFLPIVFIVVLVATFPRRNTESSRLPNPQNAFES